MALILCIETSTTVCSVALAADGKLLSLKEENQGYTHAEHITLYIQEVINRAGRELKDMDAIAVSMGPGSYTGLRIGVSTAKGLCFALDKPLIAIPTLKSMAFALHPSPVTRHNSLLCPMIDARRMEVYCDIYDTQLNEVKKTATEIITENSFAELLKVHKILFFGDGAEKCKAVLVHHPNAVFIDKIFPSAASMITFAEEKFVKQDFENVALFEPFYLKDFIAGSKKNN